MNHALALSAALVCAVAPAHAQLIRPDTATATSEFSSSYLAVNMINGSGLPADFTPDTPHATYVGGNHWTTRANQTIGQSATFGFTQPKRLGGFYMWNHRSNGVAANPHYAVTRFDLVFRDASNTIITTLTNIPALANIATAQTFPFNTVENVSSVQFIVRATANNNSSQYTGLAEVAFAECLLAGSSPAPSLSICRGETTVLDVTATGTGPFSYQWQFADENAPGGWADLEDGEHPTLQVTFSGADSSSLTVVAETQDGTGGAGTILVRCVIANECSDTASQPSQLNICACLECPADFNEDGGIDGSDVDAFFAAWELGVCDADVNADGGVDGSDVDAFFAAWEAGGCD
ncbi:MAG: hypothetical protein KF859_07730 [Phycisphaeraceae bacterium]|nr:hypothetical protein [Phycisphaeraceae bacterium]